MDLAVKKTLLLLPFDLRNWRWAASAAVQRSPAGRRHYNSIKCSPKAMLS